MPKIESSSIEITNAIVSLWRVTEDSAVLNITLKKDGNSLAIWIGKDEAEEVSTFMSEFGKTLIEQKKENI